MILFRRLLELFGIEPDRVQVSWISAAQGVKFAETATALVARARELGPIDKLVRNYRAPWSSDAPEDFAAACAACPDSGPCTCSHPHASEEAPA